MFGALSVDKLWKHGVDVVSTKVLELNVLCFLWPAKRFLVLLVIVCSYKITLHLLIYLGIFW